MIRERIVLTIGALLLISTTYAFNIDLTIHPIRDVAYYLAGLRPVLDPNIDCIFLCEASCSISNNKAQVVYEILPKKPTVDIQTCINQLLDYYKARCVQSSVDCAFKTPIDAHCTYDIEARQDNTNIDQCLSFAFNNTYVSQCDDSLLGQLLYFALCKTPLGK